MRVAYVIGLIALLDADRFRRDATAAIVRDVRAAPRDFVARPFIGYRGQVMHVAELARKSRQQRRARQTKRGKRTQRKRM